MFQTKLAHETKRIKGALGDCLLLIKCYDLLGDQLAAQTCARSIYRQELEDLNAIVVSGAHIDYVATFFIGAIYTAHIAGKVASAHEIRDSFLKKVQESTALGSPLSEAASLPLLCAQVILRDHTNRANKYYAPDSLWQDLANSWSIKSTAGIAKGVGLLDQYILELEENEEIDFHPWVNVWEYILSNRLHVFLSEAP